MNLSHWRVLLALSLLLPGVSGHRADAAEKPPNYCDPAPPYATVPKIRSVIQRDLNGDLSPDLTIIDGSYATDHDRVLVFDGARNMRQSSDWARATDFVDDLWLFDVGANSERRGALAIQFSIEDGENIARIYDRSAGGDVQVSLQDATARVTAPAHPSLILRATGGWTRPDGGLNYNTRWTFDGPATDPKLALRLPQYFALDGVQDWEAAIEDRNDDGVPEFIWSTLLAPIHSGEGIARGGALGNSGLHRPDNPENVIFWPWFNVPTRAEERNYLDTPPHPEINWTQGLICTFRFHGYPIEVGFHSNSTNEMRRNRVNKLAFENQMAYFDLANDQDGRPELFVRAVHQPAGNPLYVEGGPTVKPLTMIQYSWNQVNNPDMRWDFKLDVAGTVDISQVVTLGEMRLAQVPHDQLPAWVGRQNWNIATFVAFESGPGYESSEGLYEWSTLEGIQFYKSKDSPLWEADLIDQPTVDQTQRQYISGRSLSSPESTYAKLPIGFRGEYADLRDTAMLYFSPIDRRMHLLGASSGVYNLGGGRSMTFASALRNGHIDLWRVYEGDRVVAQMLHTKDHLIVADQMGLAIWQAQIPAERFRSAAPASHADWLALGAQLYGAMPRTPEIGALDDFRAMAAQFGEATQQIRGVSVGNMRAEGEGGFRFELQETGKLEYLGKPLIPLETPAETSVIYRDAASGAIRRVASGPINPSVTMLPIPMGDFGASEVRVVVANPSALDLQNAILEVELSRADRSMWTMITRTISLQAGSAVTLTLPWAAYSPGNWHAQTRVRFVGNTIGAVEPAQFEISAPPPLTAGDVVLGSGYPAYGVVGLVGLGLCLLLLLRALVAARQYTREKSQ